VGRDNRKIFPEVAQEACLRGDDLFICSLLFKPGQVVCGAAQRSLKWIRELEDPESPHHGLQVDIWGAEGGSSCRGETPMPSDLEADFPEPEVQRQVKVTGDADFCRDREVLEIPEPEEPAAEGDADFCRDREVLEIPEPEGPAAEADADILAFAVGGSLQAGEERHVYLVEEEAPVIRLDKRANDWEVDSDGSHEPEGAARGLSSPTRISEME
jgi:hypothetical protein